jgi:hypothetical protein
MTSDDRPWPITDDAPMPHSHRYANLLAAARAAVAAAEDGEPDPLWYLRDELGAESAPRQDHR